MNTIGDIIGYGNGMDEGIVTFNELSKRKEPMGRFRNFAVFADRSGTVPEFGKSYYCYLRKDSKANILWAAINTEVTVESILSINPEAKKEIADIIYKEYPEAFKSEVSALQMKEFEDKIREKYKAENATLRSKIEHLENELSKLSEISRREMAIVPGNSETGVDNGLLHDSKLEDGEYTVRMNLKETKALFVKCEGGEFYCTSGYIDISSFLKRHSVSKPLCRHCDELDGALLTL